MTKIVSKALRDSARGESCTLRLPGCNFNPETVVLAHAPIKGMRGMGMKVPDVFSMYSCSNCHDAIDGRKKSDHDASDILRALAETQLRMIEKGLITIKGLTSSPP